MLPLLMLIGVLIAFTISTFSEREPQSYRRPQSGLSEDEIKILKQYRVMKRRQ